MPWSSTDAKRFTRRARTPKQKRQWRSIANSALERGHSEGRAIQIASGVVKKRQKGGRMDAVQTRGRRKRHKGGRKR